jgi:hypothetical protein
MTIQLQGYYDYKGTRIDFAQQQKESEAESFLLTPNMVNS